MARDVPEPRDEGLQRAVGAPPPVVVELVLHVVVVGVGALHQVHAAPGRAALEALVDVGQRAGAGGAVLGEDEAVHPPEQRPVDGQHEEAVDVLAEFGCGGCQKKSPLQILSCKID